MRCMGVLLLVALGAHADGRLPIKSAKLTEGTYTISGRHTLDKSVRLTLGPGVKVVGHGEHAVLDLDGGVLEVAGEPGAEVLFENVWVMLGWKFGGLRVSHAKFTGAGGVYVAHESETRGKARLERVVFSGDAAVWVTFHEGSLELRDVTAHSTCQVASTGSDRNVKLEIAGCRFLTSDKPGVISGGLRVSRVKDVSMVNTRVGGLDASFKECTKFVMEGCRFDTPAVRIQDDRKGHIGNTRIVRCDFASETIEIDGPVGGGERVTLQECHFVGDATTDPESIVRKRIKAKSVQVIVKAPKPEPNDLAGPEKPD